MENTKLRETVQDQIIIEQITSAQAPQYTRDIVNVYKEGWISTYQNQEYNITKADLEERFADFDAICEEWKETLLNSENRGYWIVRDNSGKIVGFCIAKKEAENNELEYIYLLPEYQGRKIGHKLMDEALSWLGNSKPVVLFGAAYNTSAINFYHKFGFTLSQEVIPPKVLPNGKHIPSMKMEKLVR